jgi:beta-lactamase regulating signal transducer with metallopeptidase domain
MNTASFVSDEFVRALGWTLAHSLWQGAAAALALLILFPRLQTARQRYWAAYSALSAVFAAAVATFAWVYSPLTNVPAAAAFASETPLAPVFFVENQFFETTIWERTANWLEANYPLIVAVWLLGFGFFALRLASGLWHVNRLAKSGTPLSENWEEKMAALSERLGMTRPVRLLESALVHAPAAIGWLKPVILLPIGMVNRLSVAEVEAVLAHELAHIARRDWLFNLLQAFVETLFYYHPAVWWMSQVVRNERENCCDDAALAATGNRLAFARALVQVQEMAKPAPLPALALGMSGKSRPLLLERVRRILNQPQQKSQIMEKFAATVILLALLALVGLRANNAPSLSAAFAQMAELPAVLFGDQNGENQIVNDSVPKPKSTRKIIREDDDQRVEAEYQDGKLTRLNIDGKEIPEAEFDQHRDLTNELRRELRAPLAPLAPMPPGLYFFSPDAPAPAIAPMPPMPPMPRISTSKDGEGNTIIVFERDGEPTEIKVKDGQVWINGDELEEGESLDLEDFGNGFYYWNGDDGDEYHFAPKAGFHFENLENLEGLRYLENLDDFPHFQLSDEDRARLEEEMARVRSDADRIRHEHRQIVEEQRRLREEEMRLAQKELKEHQKVIEKEMKEQQKEWKKEQKEWAKEQEKWAKEQARWADEQAKSTAFGKELKAQLQRDGLISDPSNFQFQLSANELKINEKKQSGDLHRKYMEFYKSKTGKEVSKNWNFKWTESN